MMTATVHSPTSFGICASAHHGVSRISRSWTMIGTPEAMRNSVLGKRLAQADASPDGVKLAKGAASSPNAQTTYHCGAEDVQAQVDQIISAQKSPVQAKEVAPAESCVPKLCHPTDSPLNLEEACKLLGRMLDSSTINLEEISKLLSRLVPEVKRERWKLERERWKVKQERSKDLSKDQLFDGFLTSFAVVVQDVLVLALTLQKTSEKLTKVEGVKTNLSKVVKDQAATIETLQRKLKDVEDKAAEAFQAHTLQMRDLPAGRKVDIELARERAVEEDRGSPAFKQDATSYAETMFILARRDSKNEIQKVYPDLDLSFFMVGDDKEDEYEDKEEEDDARKVSAPVVEDLPADGATHEAPPAEAVEAAAEEKPLAAQ